MAALDAPADRPGLILVDDDPLIVDSLDFALGSHYRLHAAANRRETLRLLQRLHPVPDLALVDLGLPPNPHAPDEGFALIGDLLSFNRTMKILILSGQSERATIQHALTLGAVDFVPKPCDSALLRARLQHQQLLLEAELPRAGRAAELLGGSAAIEALRGLIQRFADTPFPVLIEGESGTGKELVASCLHQASARADFPLLTINCAAFAPDLLEAQLFGHRKGAFTGATEQREGFFSVASRGTLFLDEVGEMPLELQSKFLRVLENGEYYPIGETTPRHTETRIIAATNRNLREAVRVGALRPDLFHRLTVLTLSVPPLRARGDDWGLLMENFQAQYRQSVAPFRLDESARQTLAGYGFPGNVRELRNIVIRLGAKYPGQTVIRAQVLGELEPDIGAVAPAGPELTDARIAAELEQPGFRLDDAVMRYERSYIEAALHRSEGNLSRAARLLGVNRTTLYSRLQKLGLAN